MFKRLTIKNSPTFSWWLILQTYCQSWLLGSYSGANDRIILIRRAWASFKEIKKLNGRLEGKQKKVYCWIRFILLESGSETVIATTSTISYCHTVHRSPEVLFFNALKFMMFHIKFFFHIPSMIFHIPSSMFFYLVIVFSLFLNRKYEIKIVRFDLEKVFDLVQNFPKRKVYSGKPLALILKLSR